MIPTLASPGGGTHPLRFHEGMLRLTTTDKPWRGSAASSFRIARKAPPPSSWVRNYAPLPPPCQRNGGAVSDRRRAFGSCDVAVRALHALVDGPIEECIVDEHGTRGRELSLKVGVCVALLADLALRPGCSGTADDEYQQDSRHRRRHIARASTHPPPYLSLVRIARSDSQLRANGLVVQQLGTQATAMPNVDVRRAVVRR